MVCMPQFLDEQSCLLGVRIRYQKSRTNDVNVVKMSVSRVFVFTTRFTSRKNFQSCNIDENPNGSLVCPGFSCSSKFTYVVVRNSASWTPLAGFATHYSLPGMANFLRVDRLQIRVRLDCSVSLICQSFINLIGSYP